MSIKYLNAQRRGVAADRIGQYEADRNLNWEFVRSFGLPFRSSVKDPMLTPAQLEDRMEVTRDAVVKIWNVAQEKDREEYRQTIDRSLNGLCKIFFIQRQIFSPSEIIVYVEFANLYGEILESGLPADSE